MKLSSFSYNKKDLVATSLVLGMPILFPTGNGKSKVYAICSSSFSCSGGGGQCGSSFDCSGGGGQCGSSFDCSGGGGKCGSSFNCGGS